MSSRFSFTTSRSWTCWRSVVSTGSSGEPTCQGNQPSSSSLWTESPLRSFPGADASGATDSGRTQQWSLWWMLQLSTTGVHLRNSSGLYTLEEGPAASRSITGSSEDLRTMPLNLTGKRANTAKYTQRGFTTEPTLWGKRLPEISPNRWKRILPAPTPPGLLCHLTEKNKQNTRGREKWVEEIFEVTRQKTFQN